MSKIKISSMVRKNIVDVSTIHLSALPDDFCSLLGHRFLLTRYYPYVLSDQENISLVATDNNGMVVGFISASKADGFYTKFLKQNFFAILKHSLISSLKEPRFLNYIIEIIKLLFDGNSFRPKSSDAELLYIAIKLPYQKQRIGSKLLNELIEELKRQGVFHRCIVKTLATTKMTNDFYQSNDFEIIHEAINRKWYGRNLKDAGSTLKKGNEKFS